MEQPHPARLGRPDADAAVKEARALVARQLDGASRRGFLRQSFSLGALAMLSGCVIGDQQGVEDALTVVSRLNDRVQGWIFDPTRLAPTYPASMITRPFPFNAFYARKSVPMVDAGQWRLEVGGLVAQKKYCSLATLRAMPQHEQITRHICVEGWSAIGRWGGVRLSEFLTRVGADVGAKYVEFRCADGYYTSIDMPTALHPQTILALTYDGQQLPARYGFPAKVRMPTKLGYKNPKHITALWVTNTHSGGYWEDRGYNWFGGS